LVGNLEEASVALSVAGSAAGTEPPKGAGLGESRAAELAET